MEKKIKASSLADAIMDALEDYAETTTEDVKTAVKNAGKTVQKGIESSAPRRTGAYSRSWRVKNTKETSTSLQVTVHSQNRYQLAHLLEHGHAKRGGGRVAARPHIANAEELGIRQLEEEIERSLSRG